MSKIHPLLGAILISSTTITQAQNLEQAEVRLSYAEFKSLLQQANPPTPKAAVQPIPKPTLLTARLTFEVDGQQPILRGNFKVASFSDDIASTPLIRGNIAVDQQEPATALVVIDNQSISLVTRQAGTQNLSLRLLPQTSKQGYNFQVPPCPSAILEIGKLPDHHSVILLQGDQEIPLGVSQSIPLTSGNGEITLRLLDDKETEAATRPPEPSEWAWQHQAIVDPIDGELTYQLITQASATGGSGVDAILPMPADARDIAIRGEDLVSFDQLRGDKRSLSIALHWKTRGILDRQILVSYRMPLRPLDNTWQLQAPGNETTKTRFLIPENPHLNLAATGLSISSRPDGLPAKLAEPMFGRNYRYLETTTQADLKITRIPVAATAEGVIKQAVWNIDLEADGAMLVAGNLTIEHRSPLEFEFDTPDNMKLLKCELNGKPIAPVDSGSGKLMLSLTATSGNSRLTCSFTGRNSGLDPVEGTLQLTLPLTPLFIHSLDWTLNLPGSYQAETHGNLKRIANSQRPSTIALHKNFCRGERPGVQVFYKRSDLNR